MTTSMLIKIPETVLFFANCKKSASVMNLPSLFAAGFLAKPD